MATINYADKVAINVNPNIPEINKVTDGNMNLIKQVGNQILTTMGVYTDDWNSSSTYAIGDIVIYDNRIFRNLTGTNTETTPDLDTTNWEETTIAAMAGGADIPIRPTAPVNPSTNDLWIDTSDDNRLKYFNGISWVGVSDNITGDTLPIGAIVPFGGWDAPTGWLICDGTLLNKTDYPELFNAIGYSFGGEEGGSTFGLPDLRGRVPLGLKETDTDFNGMGLTGGEKTHTLTIQEMPSHGHNFAGGYGSGSVAEKYSYGTVGTASTYGIENTGGGQAHNIMNPYQTVNYIIKATQSAGLVANVSKTYSTSEDDTYACSYINGIVESGSNANGYYTKYTDGTLICRYFVGPITTNAGAETTTAVTFPYEFINTDWQTQLTMTNGQSYWSYVFTNVSDKTKTGFNLKTWNNGGGTNSGQYFDYVTIGRWK